MSRVRAPSPALAVPFGGRATRNGVGALAVRVSRGAKGHECADVAQLVEHTLGKGEVTGSIPVVSSHEGRGNGKWEWFSRFPFSLPVSGRTQCLETRSF